MTKEENIAHLKAEIERLRTEKPRGYANQISEYEKAVRVLES
jgi:uncharacterized small protein (DUF1192 family)